MKVLENPKFEALNQAMSRTSDGFVVEGRLESYSCKMTASDKKLFRFIIEHNNRGDGKESGKSPPSELHALSPPQSVTLSVSPLARGVSRSWSEPGEVEEATLCDTITTRTLFYLISALNASYDPDYDFSTAKSEEFSREPRLQNVMSEIDGQLATKVTSYSQLRTNFWAAVDEEIMLKECELYSYNPDLGCDPFGEEGSIMGLNYFFFNKKLKRLVFFTARYTTLEAAEESGDQGYASSLVFDGSDFDEDRHEDE